MKNTFGQSLAVTLFGESHGEAVGAVIDGLAPGIPVDKKEIEKLLSKRRPSSALDTARRENDDFSILSGVFEGRTTGTPLCIVIKNVNSAAKILFIHYPFRFYTYNNSADLSTKTYTNFIKNKDC